MNGSPETGPGQSSEVPPVDPVTAMFKNVISKPDNGGSFDEPYKFGWRPRAKAPFPFTERQYARLLIFRGRVQDGLAAPQTETLTKQSA
jgi:hypothetical protein